MLCFYDDGDGVIQEDRRPGLVGFQCFDSYLEVLDVGIALFPREEFQLVNNEAGVMLDIHCGF